MNVKVNKNLTGKSFLSLDPRTKIYLLLIINIMVVAGGSEGIILYLEPLLILVPLVLLFGYKRIKLAIILTCVYFVSYYSSVIFPFISPFSMAGTLLGLATSLVDWIVPCLTMGYILVFTTTVSEFIVAMEKLKLGMNITIPFAVMFRFFPTIIEEHGHIQDAMRIRGIGIKSGPITLLEYRMVPLLTSMVKIGDELSAAAITRGLGSSIKRTNICKIGFGIYDIAFSLYVTIIVVVYILFQFGGIAI